MDDIGAPVAPVGRSTRVKRRVVLGAALAGVAVIALLALGLVLRDSDGSGTRPAEAAMLNSGPIVINGAAGKVIENLVISNPNGDCVQIVNSSGIELRNLQIGPCKGRGILLENSSDVVVSGSVIEAGFKPSTCCDLGSGILALRSSGIRIEGNVLTRNETNIEVISTTGVTIMSNTLSDPLGPFPRGQQIQLARSESKVSDVVIAGNVMTCNSKTTCNQEDAINVYGATDTTINYNLIIGGFSKSGCGVVVENNAKSVYVGFNRIYDTGNCGIGIAGGSNHLVESNQVLLTREVTGGGNVGIYVWRIDGTCGAVVVRDNLSSFIRRDGSHHGFWDGGGCIVTINSNIFGETAVPHLLADEASHLVQGILR